MTKRITPPGGVPAAAGLNKVPSGVHAMRRGGARREVTERVTLIRPAGGAAGEGDRSLEGWALNVSRGGLRAILEERVVLGEKFDVALGSDEVIQRSGRIVWVQEEPDGVIVGIEFTSLSGTHKSVPPPPPDAEALEPDADKKADDEPSGSGET